MNKLVLLLTAVVLGFEPHASAFIDLNGDFESGALSPWFQDNNFSAPGASVGWYVTSFDAHSGLYSATCTGNIELRQNLTPILTSDITDVSLWLKQPFGPAISFVTFFYTDSTSSGDLISLTSTDWQEFDITSYLDLSPGKELDAVSLYGYSGGDSTSVTDQTYLDDFEIVATPEPAACWLICLGLSGLLLRRGIMSGKLAR